jgi:membrane protease YdiL (CAAX protease family)
LTTGQPDNPTTSLRRPRLKAFLLFLAFAVLANLLEPAISWLVLIKAHAIDPTDRSWHPSLFIWFESCSALAALLATWTVARLASRSMASLGVGAPAAKQVAAGSLFGFVAVAILVGGIAALGGFSPGHIAMSGTPLVTYVLAWLLAMVGIGLAEELTFRGAGLITLGEAIGFWPAAIVITLIFAALHYFGKGPAENVADALSVGLLGLFMSFTVLRTGSIWFAVGFHALFDYAALYVFGAPNSGNRGGTPIDTRLFTGTFHGPTWLTGGPLGVEASWLIFPIIALLFFIFDRTHRPLRASEQAVGYNPPAPI